MPVQYLKAKDAYLGFCFETRPTWNTATCQFSYYLFIANMLKTQCFKIKDIYNFS